MLSLVIVVLFILVIMLATYLLILTQVTAARYNVIHSDRSYYLALGKLKSDFVHYLATSADDSLNKWPSSFGVQTSVQAGNTIIEREINKLEDGKVEFVFRAVTNNLPRTIRAILNPPIVTTNKADVVLVVDISDSMNEYVNPTVTDTKLDKAVDAIKVFVDEFSENTSTRIGLIAYETLVDRKTAGLITDFNQVKNLAQALVAPPNGSTNIGGALQEAANLYTEWPLDEHDPSDQGRKRYAVLLTDGIPTVNENQESCQLLVGQCVNDNFMGFDTGTVEGQADLLNFCRISIGNPCMISARSNALTQANVLKSADTQAIQIFSIGLGDIQATPPEIDEGLLQEIASEYGFQGQKLYWSTPNAEELAGIYQLIAQTIIGDGMLMFKEPLVEN